MYNKFITTTFFLLSIGFLSTACTEGNSIAQQEKPAGYVNKASFQGKWALTKDEAILKCVNVGGGITGTTVEIDGQTYALSRNINNVEFLPLQYWLDAPTEDIGTFKNVCSDIMLDSNTCKVSVSDMVQYADKLCK